MSVLEQEPEYWHQEEGNAREKRRAGAKPEVREEGAPEEREDARDGGPEEVVAREDRRGVGGVRGRDVHEDALEVEEDAGEVERGADDGRDPVHARLRGEAEDEKAGGDEDARHEADFEANLWRDFGVGGGGACVARSNVILLVEAVDSVLLGVR